MRQFTELTLEQLIFDNTFQAANSKIYRFYCKTPALDTPGMYDEVAYILFSAQPSSVKIDDFSYTSAYTRRSLHQFHIGSMLFQKFISFITSTIPTVKVINGLLSSADYSFNNWQYSIPFYLSFKYINIDSNVPLYLDFKLFTDKSRNHQILIPSNRTKTDIRNFASFIINEYSNTDLYFTFEILYQT